MHERDEAPDAHPDMRPITAASTEASTETIKEAITETITETNPASSASPASPASPAEGLRGRTGLRTANKTQAAEYHPDFIDVPGEYLEVRSFYRALIMLTCEACAIALIQAADDEENLYPSGLARTFDKPVAGIVTKTDVMHSDIARAETILREAGATEVFFTSALNNTGIDELIRHLDKLRE